MALAASKTETRVVPGVYDTVFQSVCQAAAAGGMTVAMADPQAGVIHLSTSMGLATWGENLTVHLRPAPAGVEVTVASSLKFGLVDWGKNQQNINDLFWRLSTVPGQPAGGWHPDPAGRHQLRWWDGGRWTETVSDRGQVGTDPL
jgi:hypothetical protein